jgi:diguanylate cyclase (GGDEF)-like protein/PAS domain S-box-containing protein
MAGNNTHQGFGQEDKQDNPSPNSKASSIEEKSLAVPVDVKSLLAAVVESSDDAILTKTLDGIILSWNAAAEHMYGYTAEEAIGRPIYMLVPPDRYHEVRQILGRIKLGERILHFESVRVHKDGSRIDVSLSLSPVKDGGGDIIAVSVIARDITQQKQQQEALQENERRLFDFLEAVPVGIFVLDSRGRPYYANQSAQHLLGKGIDPQFSTGKLAETYHSYLAGTDQPYPADRMPITRALNGERVTTDDMEIQRPEGRIPLQVSATPIYDSNGHIVYAVAAFNDITERRRDEAMLRQLAGTDELTGLYNRREMLHLLRTELERCQRSRSFLSLIMIDVDYFKQVNDTYGHTVGDGVLKQIAEIIRSHIRSTDRAARYGGEELAIVLPETADSGACRVAERIRMAIAAHTFTSEEHRSSEYLLPVRVTASMGIACFPTDASSVDALIQTADSALYNAKNQGRNRVVLANTNAFSTRDLQQE